MVRSFERPFLEINVIIPGLLVNRKAKSVKEAQESALDMYALSDGDVPGVRIGVGLLEPPSGRACAGAVATWRSRYCIFVISLKTNPGSVTIR